MKTLENLLTEQEEIFAQNKAMINSETIIYNNKNIRQILSNMPIELKKFKP